LLSPPSRTLSQLSSLYLEILIFFNWWFLAAYLFVNVVLMIYKGNKLYYPDDTLVWDAVILGLYMLVEAVRGRGCPVRACVLYSLLLARVLQLFR
jgi:hypothetical protein